LPFGRISAIGPHAVIIPDGKAVIDVNRDAVLKRLYNDQKVRGLRVLTDDGHKLGVVEDLLLDGKTGEIRGYYVSLGKGLTMGQGMRWLPAENVLNMGMRVLYVPASVAQDFEQQSGGVAGALDQAGEKLRTVGAKANERLETWGDKAKESGARLNEQLGQVGEQVRTDVSQRATGVVAGKIAHETVMAADGTPIVQEGETITETHVERARQEGRTSQLVLAAGVRPAKQTMGSIADQAGQSFNDIGQEARQLWNQLTGNYARAIDQADDKVMQRRIKNALGRPANRVILDNDDNIILNMGDIITNRAVEAARTAGVLDILVDSAYAERPRLETEDLKAPSTGHASLEALESGEDSEGATGTRPISGRARRGSTSTSEATTSEIATIETSTEEPGTQVT